jgi:serine/threonine protein kinase
MSASRIPGAPSLRLGEALGGYRLDSLVGEGAMGLVFRATRLSDGTVVALKLLKRELSRDDLYRQRFVREVRVAREVRDAHLVPIVDAGDVGGYQYLAMRYVNGGSLADRLEEAGALPLPACLRLVAEVGAGLDALHRRGVTHRDVKPSNVMLEPDGSAALTDFGLAKGRAYTVLTRPGQVMGTLDYLAPELIRGEDARPASDIYALGCVAYECLSGSAPFADRRIFDVAVAHLHEEPPDLHERHALPPDVAVVVRHALAKEPERRPRTGTAFAHLLRAAAGPVRG